MSLREEIKERLGAMFDRYQNFDDDLNVATNDVIKIIINRIDSRISYFKSDGKPELFGNLEIIEELQEIKEEMLK